MPHVMCVVPHKHQSKLNDCWYACIQMIRTTHVGQKTKTVGADANYLHGGAGGHRLGPGGNHMPGIMHDNQLVDITSRIDLTSIDNGGSGGVSIARMLQTRGPFMLIGNFGAAINIPVIQVAVGRVFGHWIVVAGADDMGATERVWIHDPMLWAGKWMSLQRLNALYMPGNIPNTILAAR
jgi:hypothetical protein